MTDNTRMEKDPLGELAVPADALYGVQTLRAVQNFPDQRHKALAAFRRRDGSHQEAAAMTHKKTGRLDAKLADAIIAAADEVLGGQHRDQFVVGRLSAGAGTSHNMNVNEVLANRAE
jgi:aspartate ammonia-lyase